MAKYRKILAAFDGSDSARNALRQAIELARTERSWIKLLAVVPDYEGDAELVGVDEIREVIKGPIKALLDEALEMIRAAGLPVLSDIDQGEAYHKIVDVSEDESCDLIVMGRKGRHRIEKMLMGSVTSQVVSTSSRDVLIVPHDATLKWDRILYALDGTSHPSAMEKVLEFARSYDSQLHVVSVVDMYPEFYAEAPQIVEKLEKISADALRKFESIAGKQGVTVETHLMRGDPHTEIIDCAKEMESGVILMGKGAKTSLVKLVSGDSVGKVIGFSQCPVLVIADSI